MKKVKLGGALTFVKKHIRTVAAFTFVALVCVAVYIDWNNGFDGITPNSDYLYTASYDTDSAKILGEATLVDGISPEDTPYTEVSSTEPKDSYFLSAAADRERSRDEALQTLQTVVDSSETMPDVKDEALEKMISIAGNIETESNVETMIKAKGFEDCLAVVNDDGVNIVVKTSGLLTNEVAQIREIAMQETGFSPDNIKIIEKN